MKKTISILTCALCVFGAAACSETVVSENDVKLSYFDGISADGSYNTDLFYRNDLQVSFAADPGVFWVDPADDGTYGGYFYMYTTGSYFPCYRSTDLNAWEYMGFALDLPDSTWVYSSMWAPEVVRSPLDGKYYMYYNAASKVGTSDTSYSSSTDRDFDRLYLSVAVAETPIGPFRQFTGYNADGTYITESDPVINFRKALSLDKDFPALDITPYFDDDGEMYVYFASKNVYADADLECIWGMKMKDMVTPDYTTMTQLAYPGYSWVTGTVENPASELGDLFLREYGQTCINEAPFMLKRNGKYYLTYSSFSLSQRMYSVSMAVSDSPLGKFVKPSTDVCNPVIAVESQFDHMGGTGHHCFVSAGDELWAVYHCHMNRATGEGNPRAIAIDRMNWVYEPTLGYDMLYANGPTYSLQPLAESVSGYRNLSVEAKVTVENVIGEDTEQYLTDGLFVSHYYAEDRECTVKDKTCITLAFEKPVEITAVMVYNSFDYYKAFAAVDYIRFACSQPPTGVKGNFSGYAYVQNVAFSDAYYNHEEQFMRPGGSALAEFAPMKVTEIKIYISEKLTATDRNGLENNEIAIGDVVVLGKS